MKSVVTLVRRVNFRHYRMRPLRALMTGLGITAGVALVTSITTINATLSATVRATVEDVAGAADLEVTARSDVGLKTRQLRRVEEIAGVESAVPLLRTVTRLERADGETSLRAQILGVTPEFATLFPPGARNSVSFEGSFGLLGEGVVVSERLREELAVSRGDTIALVAPRGVFERSVTGVVRGDALRHVNGGRFAVMTLPAAQTTFSRPGRVDSVFVVVGRSHTPDDVADQIGAALGPGVAVGRPGDTAASFDRIFQSVVALTSLSGTVALFVGAFVVFNTMSMSVVERRQEIAMLLALGATRRRVVAAWLVEAAAVGFVASAAGVVAGIALGRVLTQSAVEGYRALLPISGVSSLVVRPWHVALGVGGGIIVSIGGALAPAVRTARIAAVEALRPGAGAVLASTRVAPLRHLLLGVAFLSVSAVIYARAWDGSPAVAVAVLVPGLAGATSLLRPVAAGFVAAASAVVPRASGPTGRLAVDALRRNPRRTTVTAAGLMLTAALVVGVTASLDSFTSEVERRSRYWFAAPIYVASDSYAGFSSDQPLDPSLGPALRAVDGVAAVYSVAYGALELEGERTVAYVVPAPDRRPPPGLLRDALDFRREIQRRLAGGGIIVSRLTAEDLGLSAGDVVAIPTASGVARVEVAGTFEDLAPFYSAYIRRDVYRDLWGADRIDRFEVWPTADADPAVVRRSVAALVAARSAPAVVTSGDEIARDVLSLVEGTWSIARAIQLAALLVAALTIANTMFITVVERRWEFALQRAVGMSRSQLGRAVTLEAGMIGLLGGGAAAVAGTALGALMTAGMAAQFAWDVPYVVPWAPAAAALVGGAALATVAGIHPRVVALRSSIVESLRYE